jgi:hypothetical protein
MTGPFLRLDHLEALCDETGLFEHAHMATPRRECGYTTDDNGRMLAVLARVDPAITTGGGADGLEVRLLRLSRIALAYIEHAALHDQHGFRNRLSFDRRWLDERGSDDSYGRALWGLGAVAARSPDASLRESAYRLFWSNVRLESPHSRSVIYAMLGAAEMSDLDGSPELRKQMRLWLGQLRGPTTSKWMWPESKLTYDNARYPEALMAAGRVLSDDRAVDDGLKLLSWLVDLETASPQGHFSWTPVAGRSPTSPRPGFDQQPLEAWAMIDAAWLAAGIEGSHWLEVANRARSWFLGTNDVGEPMVDLSVGAGFDGLTQNGPNRNRGAESTLAAVAAMAWATAGSRSR